MTDRAPWAFESYLVEIADDTEEYSCSRGSKKNLAKRDDIGKQYLEVGLLERSIINAIRDGRKALIGVSIEVQGTARRFLKRLDSFQHMIHSIRSASKRSHNNRADKIRAGDKWLEMCKRRNSVEDGYSAKMKREFFAR